MARITQQSSIHTTGTSYENEPIIKSDGASSNVMQWLSNNEASNVTISEDASNNLDLVVSAGNVAIGGSTFETWTTDQTVLQIGGNGAVRATTAAGANGYLQLIQNAYYDSTNNRWEYRDTDEVSMYQQNAGTHQFRVAASSTADNPITWTTALIIDSAGKVGIGAAPGNGWLHVNIAGALEWAGRFENSDDDNGYGVLIKAGDDANVTILECRDKDDATHFKVDGAGLATFSNGINLGDENLEDYDEGTWSPTVSPHVSGSVTLNSGYTTGSYVRIGNLCVCGGYLTVDSVSSPNGVLYISLPFTIADTTDYSERWGNSFAAGSLNDAAAGQMIYPNTGTTAVVQFFDDGTGTGAWLANKLQAGSFMFFGVTFRVA